ncbi:unnamed protein product [Linum tenue]|uniref:S-protein homolog n=1 Tax=Linum tenue TaxID=586396 RepID=A0AAV0LVI2_9ROSI|nr:unnamed protein product [Linum tenue]
MVMIGNALGGSVQLKAHCRSRDDDLGVRVLGPGQEFHFKFWTSFFSTTVFYCSFEWPGSGGLHWYDVYDDDRDFWGGKNYRWVIKPFAICKFNVPTKEYDRCMTWKEKHM